MSKMMQEKSRRMEAFQMMALQVSYTTIVIYQRAKMLCNFYSDLEN